MSQLPQSVSNWLFNVIQPSYIHKQLVYAHVYQILSLHLKKNLDFRIRTKVYTDEETGKSELLINLFGTINISDQIGVPVEIWVPLAYPRRSFEDQGVPIVYIVPDHSKNWFLKAGNFVDSQGKFYHPYLSSWHRQSDEDMDPSFNLVKLVDVLFHSVVAEPPITIQHTVAPPKPAKIEQTHSASATSSVGVTPQSTGSTSGPPLPAKPPKIKSPVQSSTSPTIPLKYQSPLPIPNPEIRSPPPPSVYSQLEQLAISTPPPPPPTQSQSQSQPPAQPPVQPPQPAPLPPVDLVDSEAQFATVDQDRVRALETLSLKINECFDADPIHQQVIFANENTQRVNALYNQLSHHYLQAAENSNKLDEHISHISTQVQSISSLNRELNALSERNSQSETKIAVSSACEVELNELILPDSLLVKQLYDVVSEIKAIKDTMSLISGHFHNCSEIINDKNMDYCVKTMRSLGRELFWLELTKNEIANIMKLQT